MTDHRPFARSIAVVVGIDRYRDGIPELRTAANDARRVGAILGESHGYEVIQLLDEEATQARLTTLLTRELPEGVGPDDRVFFYWAGHGVARDGDDGPNGYLLPVDARRGDEATFLHMPLVHDALLSLTCRHMLVVLDSCFSGAFRWSGTRAAELIDDDAVIHQEKYDRFVRDPAWQVITSAAQDQKAIDQLSTGSLGSRDGDGAHSPFALALFEALDGAGDVIPRKGGDGLVTATELYLYLEERLQLAAQEAGKRQTPRLWPLRKHDKGEFVFFVPGSDLTLPPAPALTFENNPWRGLASYDAADAALFFGRDAEIAALRARVEALPLTVVLGASGTGKSSLVKAGLVPRLAADGWQVLPIVRPGTTPLVALAQAVGSGDGAVAANPAATATTAAGAATATPAAIAARVEALAAAAGGRKVVLVIDQCEELITLVRTPAEREQVLTLLARLAEAHPDTVRIILTLRTDFEPNFDRSAFGERWRAGRFIVPPMSRDSLRAVIEQPAAKRVLYFEPSALVETLLDEVVATPGALPLLSFALSEMYVRYVGRRSADRAITREDYDALGGVVGALRARAEAEHDALDAAHRLTLRRVMLRMVVAEGGNLARRRVSDAELDYPDAAEHARAEEVVRRLTSARLLVEGKEADGEPFVEPAHDALVRGWGRLLDWVREEGEAPFPLAQRQRLARAAGEWERADQASQGGLVWSDAVRSAQLAPLVKARAPWLNRRELEFARRSVRGRTVRRASTAVAVAMIAAAGAWAFISGRQASERAEQVRVGSMVRTAAALAAEDPFSAGLVLGSIDSTLVRRLDPATQLALVRTSAELAVRPLVTASFGEVGSGLRYARLSPDGRWVAMGANEGLLTLSRSDSASDPIVLDQGEESAIWGVEFSPQSDRLVSTSTAGTLYVWTIGSSKRPVRLAAPDSSRFYRLSFSADGSRIAAFYLRLVTDSTTHELVEFTPSREARVFNADGSGTPLRLPLSDDELPTEDFGGGGDWLVTTDGKRARVWPIDGASRPAQVFEFRGVGVSTATLNPSGSHIAVATTDGHVHVRPTDGRVHVQPMTGQVPGRSVAGQEPGQSTAGRGRGLQLTEHSDSVVAIAWSPDGHLLATFGLDATRIWDAESGRRITRLERDGETLVGGAFSPDGSALIARSRYGYDAIVWRWDEDGKATPTVLAGHADLLETVGFTPDGVRAFTASRDGTAREWVYNPWVRGASIFDFDSTAAAVDPGENALSAVRFSHDGRLLAIATSGGRIAVAPVEALNAPRLLSTTSSTTRALVFSQDDRRLIALAVDGGRTEWALDARSGPRDTVRIESSREIMILDANVSADGRHAFGFSTPGSFVDADAPDAAPDAAVDSGLFVWHLERREPPVKVTSPDGTIIVAAVSGNGQLLATGTGRGTVHVQGVDGTGARTGIVVPDADDPYPLLPTSAAFSHDGLQLAVGWEDGAVTMHPVSGRSAGRRLAGHTQPVTAVEFADDGKRLLSVSRDGTIRIWDVRAGRSVVTLRPRGIGAPTAHFTPDGMRVLTVPESDTAASLWNADGSGGVAAFTGAGATVSRASVSPDGRWLVNALDSGGAGLFPLDAAGILRTFAVGTICLSANDRQRYLSESESESRARWSACERARGRSGTRRR
ncbi:MAG TPA: caspase family protein [Gemmatimonadaceae bacterium]|nr:caspase family protein [Gemmatimonadaceae bacterium]